MGGTKSNKNTNPLSPTSTARNEKEKRKKILKHRKQQSLYLLPDLNDMEDTMNAINKANDELEAAINPNYKASENNIDDEKKQDTLFDFPDNESIPNIEELKLSKEQETALQKLQDELEAADPDYYGFVDYNTFIQILKTNEIKLSAKHETFLMGALTLIDEGVDYLAFAHKLREIGRELQPDNTLQDICEEIAETVEKERAKSEQKELPSTNIDDITSDDIVNLDQSAFEAFMKDAQNMRGRGMSLMRQASKDVDKGSKLGELIDDLALDGAEVDYALLKTALSTIDVDVADKDLKYLINHVDESGTGFVDFNYLITFLQEMSGTPVAKWKKIEKIINKVVNRLRMIERAELRKKEQTLKLQKRLRDKRRSRMVNNEKGGNDEMAKMVAEEKRLRALKLRDKARASGMIKK